MALVFGETGMALTTFEVAMKSSWGYGNDDGVGIFWRDSKKGTRHIARFKDTKDLAKIPVDYDRMLVHFRKSTKGEGTHPFVCRCRPDLKSEQWLLMHNGAVDDTEARQTLVRPIKGMTTPNGAHTFATNIDSEPFVHAWGEIDEADLLKRARIFAAKCKSMGLTGWANLIFYNVVTDEYAIFVDNAMHIVQSKKRDITVFCSDSQWLSSASRKLGVIDEDIKSGAVIYGRGNEFNIKKKVWSLRSRTQVVTTYASSDYGAEDGDFALPPTIKPIDNAGCSIPLPVTHQTNATENYSNMADDDFKQKPLPEQMASHYFNPAPHVDPDTNERYCRHCLLGAEYHEIDDEDLALLKTAQLSAREATRMAALEQDTKVANGFNVFLKVIEGDRCIPQQMEINATGVCTAHYNQGFRGFQKRDNEWYLVKRSEYGTKKVTKDSYGKAIDSPMRGTQNFDDGV